MTPLYMRVSIAVPGDDAVLLLHGRGLGADALRPYDGLLRRLPVPHLLEGPAETETQAQSGMCRYIYMCFII